MTLFIVAALALLAGLVLLRTAARHLASLSPAGQEARPRFRPGSYVHWLGERAKTSSTSFLRKTWTLWDGWARVRFPGWTKWIFLAGAVVFIYLASSGLFFAIFIRRGMYGLPLLAHVMSGGLFAVGLAAVLMLRAGANRFDRREPGDGGVYPCPFLKNVKKGMVRKAVFWTFAVLGFVQVTTALLSMLPIFTFETQVVLIMVHRWSALGLALSGILFLDLVLPVRANPPA